jgi:hypothetical protein
MNSFLFDFIFCTEPYGSLPNGNNLGQPRRPASSFVSAGQHPFICFIAPNNWPYSFASHFAQHCKKEVKPTSNGLHKNDESQNRLARKHDKLHEIIWEIELFIVYARKD